MPQSEYDQYIWGVFKEYWPPWVEHVDSWEHHGDHEIIVHMKDDGYVTAGKDYIFGDGGMDNWHLETIRREETENA